MTESDVTYSCKLLLWMVSGVLLTDWWNSRPFLLVSLHRMVKLLHRNRTYCQLLLPDTYNCGLRMRRECWERFPRRRIQRKPLVSDPGMHHDTRITHVPWCMPGSPTRCGGENVPGIPGACTTRGVPQGLIFGPFIFLIFISIILFSVQAYHTYIVWRLYTFVM